MNPGGSSSGSWSPSTNQSLSSSSSNSTSSSSPSMNSLLFHPKSDSSNSNPNSTPSLQQDDEDEEEEEERDFNSSSPRSHSQSVWTKTRSNTRFNSSNGSNSDDEDDDYHIHSGTTPTLSRSSKDHSISSPSETTTSNSSNPIDFDPMDLSPAQPFLPHHERGNRDRPNLENSLKASKNLQPLTGLDLGSDDALMELDGNAGLVGIGQDRVRIVGSHPHQQAEIQHTGLPSSSNLQPFSTPSAFSSSRHGGDLERRFATHVSMTPPASFGSQTSNQSPFTLALNNNNINSGSSRKIGGNVGGSSNHNTPNLGPSFRSISHNHTHSIPRSHAFNSLAFSPQGQVTIPSSNLAPSASPLDPNETPIKSKVLKTRSSSTAANPNPQFSPQKRVHSHHHGRSQSQGGSALNVGGMRRTFPLNQSLRKGNLVNNHNGHLTSSSASEDDEDEDHHLAEQNFNSSGRGKGRNLAGRTFGGSDPMSGGTGLGLDLGEDQEEERDWKPSSQPIISNSSRTRAQTEGSNINNNNTSAVASRRGRAPAMLKVSSSSGSSCAPFSGGSIVQTQFLPKKDEEMDLDEPTNPSSASDEEGGQNSHPASPTPVVWDVAFPTSSSPSKFKIKDERMHELQPGPQQPVLRKNPKGRHSRTASSNGVGNESNRRSQLLDQSPPSFNIQAATPKSPSAPEFRGLGLCLGPSPSSSTSRTSKHSTMEQPNGPYQSKSLSAATGNSRSSPFKTPYKRRTSSNASERPRNRALSSASASNSSSGLLDLNIPRSNSASSATLDLDEKLKGSATLFGFASPNRNASLSSASKSHNDLNVNNRINLLSYSAPRPTTKNQSQAELNFRNGTNSVGRLFSRDSLQISNEASISTPIKSNDNKKNLIHSSLISSVKNGKEFDDSGIAFGGDSPSVEAALRNGNSKGLNFDPRKELLFQTERRLASRLGVSEDPNESLSSSSNNSIRQRSSIGDFSSPAKVRPSTLNSNFNSPNSFTSSTPLKKNGLIPNLQRQPRERSSLANETKLSNSNSNGSSLGDESEEEGGGLSGYGRPTVNRLRSGSGSNLLSIGRPSDLNSLEMARKVSTGSIGLGGGFAQSIKSSSISSTNSGFSTPQNYKNVKPLQTAFMSTGLVSKRARMNTNDGAGNSGNGTNGGEGSSNEVPIPRPNFASALGLREVVAAAAQVQSSSTVIGSGNGVGPMPDTPVKKPVSMMMPGGGGISKSLRTHQGDSSFNHASEPSPSSFTSSSNTSSGGNGVESPQIPDSCDSPTLNLLSVNGGFPELGSSNESSSSFSSSGGNGIGSSSMSRTNSNNVTGGNRLLNRVSKGSPNGLNQFQSPGKSLPRPRHHLQRQDAFIDSQSTDSDPTSPASPSIGTFSNSLLRSPSNRNSNDDQIENQVLRKGRNQNPIGSTRLSPPVNQSLKSGSINSNTNASKINSPLNSNPNQSKPLSNSTNSSAKSSASSTSFGKSKNQRDGSSHAPKVRLNHDSVSPRPLKVFGSRPPLGLARKSSFGVSSEQAIQMAMDGNSMNMAGSGPFASPQLGSDGVPMTPTRNGATLKWFEAAQIVTTPSPSHRKSNGSLPRSHRTRQLAQELSGSSTPAKSKPLGSIVIPKPQSTSKFQSQFIVQSVLGQGEFSEAVKVADKTQDGAVFAIKRMKRPFVGQKDRVRHLEEVDILRHLSSEGGHPNVISLVDAWEELGHLFIQTELCPLGTLSFFLEVYCGQVGNLDEPRLWKILTELSDGIHFIHGKGVLHLDLKPANIFITEIGTLKIGDFGMATRWPLRDPEDILDGAGIVASDPRSAPKSTSLTSTSVPAAGVRRGRRSNMRITDREGDREYLAPEILEGKYSKAADMFCLGLIMLEAAGSVVLPDNGESWQKLRHDDFSEVDLSELSQPFISVVYRLLSSQAHQRPTIQELVAYPVLNAVRKRMARGLLHSELDQLPDFEINSKDNKVGDCWFGNISLGKIFESEQANEKDQDGDETMNDGEDEADRTNDSILGLSGVQRDQRVVVDVRGALIQETDEDFLTEVLSSINQIGNEDENSTAAFLACSSPRNQTFSNSPMDQNSTLRISPSQSHSNHTQSLSESNVDSYPTRSTSSPANMSPEDPNAMDLDGDEEEEEEDEAEFFGSHQTIYNHHHGQAGSVP